MAFIAIFAALLVVCSWLAIPMGMFGIASLTLQTFAVILAGLLLNPLEALLSSVVYILLGLTGLPVCANFTSLYSKFGTPFGGYILGFVIAPVLISLVRMLIYKLLEKNKPSLAKNKALKITIYIVLAIVLGIVAVDTPALVQYMWVTGADFTSSILTIAVAFLPTDILKCVLSALVAVALELPFRKMRGIK